LIFGDLREVDIYFIFENYRESISPDERGEAKSLTKRIQREWETARQQRRAFLLFCLQERKQHGINWALIKHLRELSSVADITKDCAGKPVTTVSWDMPVSPSYLVALYNL
jgi:hypothetical protein